MNIQLHEIAGYLPYGVKCRLSHEGIVNLDSEYPNEHQHKVGVIKHFSFYEDEFSGSFWVTDKYSFDFEQQSEIEIILRPMSDLLKPEWKQLCKENDFALQHGTWGSDMTVDGPTTHWEFAGNYKTLSVLFANHFDIHNLIGRGLAIDINTI